MSKLTPHLWRLYRFIELRTDFQLKTSVRDIVDEFPDNYYLKEQKGNYSNCPQVYKDIDTLNASYEVDKTIIKNNNDFRLGTKEETTKYKNKLKREGIRLLVKAYNIDRKMRRDNQGKLLSNQLNPIDENSVAKLFHEAFIGGDYETNI